MGGALWEFWGNGSQGGVSRRGGEREHRLFMRKCRVRCPKGSEVQGRSGVLIQPLYLNCSGAFGSHGNSVALKCLICKMGCLSGLDNFSYFYQL